MPNPETTAEQQEFVDRFYWSNGPCCAGCDWWRHLSALVGECLKSPPVGPEERCAMLGITRSSLWPGAGHVLTLREHHCGSFEDKFDWSSLSPAYLRRIEMPGAPPRE